MQKDSLFVNKLAAAVIAALLIFMVVKELGSMLYHPMALDEAAFVIAEPASEDGTAVAAVEEPSGPGDIMPLLASADLSVGERAARRCVACHTFEEGGANKVGPALWEILNREKGVKDFNYSDTLAGMEGIWGYEELNGFLYSPSDYAPGTSMNYRGVKDDEDRAALIAYLRTYSANPAPLP